MTSLRLAAVNSDSATTVFNSGNTTANEEDHVTSASFARGRTCAVCHERMSAYQCPRCNIVYCSMVCYQTHGVACTEAFYREQIQASVAASVVSRAVRPASGMRSIMAQVLHKSRNARDDTESSCLFDDDTHDRDDEQQIATLTELASRDDFVISDLPAGLQAKFLNSLRNGARELAVDAPRAWFEVQEVPRAGIMLAHEWRAFIPRRILIHQHGDPFADTERAPRLAWSLDSLPALSMLTKIEPSTYIKFNVANVIYAYAYVYTLFENGRAFEASSDNDVAGNAASMLVGMSAALSLDSTFQDLATALHSAMQQSMQPHSKTSLYQSTLVLRHVAQIFFHHEAVIRALGHVASLVTATAIGNSAAKKRTAKISRKLYYFACWAKQEKSVVEAEALSIVDVYCERMENISDQH